MYRVILNSNQSKHQLFCDGIQLDKNKQYICRLISASIDGSSSSSRYAVSLFNNSGYLHDVRKTFCNTAIDKQITFELDNIKTKDKYVCVNPDFFKDYTIDISLFSRPENSVLYELADITEHIVHLDLLFVEI